MLITCVTSNLCRAQHQQFIAICEKLSSSTDNGQYLVSANLIDFCMDKMKSMTLQTNTPQQKQRNSQHSKAVCVCA